MIGGGGGEEDQFAFYLHINCVNSRPGHVLGNLPGSGSLRCGFPTCLRASWLPVVWPQLGKGRGEGWFGLWPLASPRPTKQSLPHPKLAPRALPASLLWGAQEASPDALREAPGWLRDGSNHAQGLLALCLPKRGPPSEGDPAGVPRALPSSLGRAAHAPPSQRPQQRPGAQRQWAGEGLSPPTGAK